MRILLVLAGCLLVCMIVVQTSMKQFVWNSEAINSDLPPPIVKPVNSDLLNSTLQSTLDLLRATNLSLHESRLREEKLQEVHEQLKKVLTKSQQRAGDLTTTLRKYNNTVPMEISLPALVAKDDGLAGKACKPLGDQWQCRDCGLSARALKWNECQVVQPHTSCPSWPVQGYDEPRPRFQSWQDEWSTSHYGMRHALSRFGYRGLYEQIPCTVLDCFNLTRCQTSTETLQVYAYGKSASSLVSGLAEKEPTLVQLATPEEACLFVVTPRSFARDEFNKLVDENPYWDTGRNHFLWQAHRLLDYVVDYPFGNENWQRAAISQCNFHAGLTRDGYDVPLYYDRPQKPFTVNTTIYEMAQDLVRSRLYLLMFQGTIKDRSLWYQHRWLASAYWPKNDSSIILNTRCVISGSTIEEQNSEGVDYVTALLSSVFSYCPGGRSPGSWRFGESLSLGAIPVVTADFLPPFTPEIDWNDCLVRVSQARIIDLPRILSLIPQAEIEHRQLACQELFRATIGWMPKEKYWQLDVEVTSFATAMRLWKTRITQALSHQDARMELKRDLNVK